MHNFEMQKTTLPNGVRIITESKPDSKNVTCFIHYNAGSRDELSHEKGIAHFLEHMIFKGSEKFSGQEILKRLAIYGNVNACTGEEETMYHFKTPVFNLPIMIETYGDSLLNPMFKQSEIDTERNTVIQELLLYEDDLSDVADNLAKKVFFHGHQISSPVVGDIDILMNLKTIDFKRFYNRNYTNPEGIVIVAVGGVIHDEFVNMIGPYFSELYSLSTPLISTIPKQHGGIEWLEKYSEQTYLTFGLNGPNQFERNVFTEQILCNMMGGPWMSRLFRKIRVDKGMAYGIDFGMCPFSDTGVTGVSVTTEYPIECLEIICNEINKLMTVGFTEEELKDSKETTLTAYNMQCEESNYRIARILASELFDRPYLTYDEVYDKFNSVTMDDVVSYANKYWKDSPIVCVGVGKEYDMVKAEKIINKTIGSI